MADQEYENKAVLMGALWRLISGHPAEIDWHAIGGTTVTIGTQRSDGQAVQATIYMGDLRPIEIKDQDAG